MNETRDVIVIGAGIAGLTAAYELRNKGLKVLLLERDSTVGGVMRSEMRDGYLLEWGPNTLLASPEVDQLIVELGLKDQLVMGDNKAPRYIYFRNSLKPVPMSPISFVTSSLLSPLAKLRIFAEPFISARRDLAENTEESIASFIKRRFGTQIHDRLVSPFISGIYAGDTEKLSIQATLAKIAELEQKYGSVLMGGLRAFNESKAQPLNSSPAKRPDAQTAQHSQKDQSNSMPNSTKRPAGRRLCSFKQGMGSLPHRLAERLGDILLLNCAVEKVSISLIDADNRYQVEFRDNGQLRTVSAAKLILATPSDVTARLLAQSLPNLADKLADIEYTPMAIVYLGFAKSDVPHDLHGFGFLVPRTEQIRLLGSLWSSSQFKGRAPEDSVLFTTFIGGATDAQAVDLSDNALYETVIKELQQIFKMPATPKFRFLRRWARAIPQYNLGHAQRVKEIDEIVARHPGLYLASNYLHGVSVPDTIGYAQKLATKC